MSGVRISPLRTCNIFVLPYLPLFCRTYDSVATAVKTIHGYRFKNPWKYKNQKYKAMGAERANIFFLKNSISKYKIILIYSHPL